MVLTALVNSSTQNKLSGSVGASSGEFHRKVCALPLTHAHLGARMSEHACAQTLFKLQAIISTTTQTRTAQSVESIVSVRSQ